MTTTGSTPAPGSALPGDALDTALAQALRTVESNICAFGARYPDDTTVDGVYHLRAPTGGLPEGANVGWTTSFWPGMLWLAFELTGRDIYRRAAQAHVRSFADRAEHRIDVATHDLGFLYTLGCVVPWRLTGDVQGRDAAVLGARLLMSRFLEPAGIIQAWGDLDDARQSGRTIIDSLMNMPLLYWTSEITGDPRYRAAAHRHTAQVRDHLVRADAATFHSFYWDPRTGAPVRGATEQGHRDDSCWARGQSWAIYGFALNHRYTGDPSFLDAAERCADYFLAHLPADGIPYWDLVFTDGSGQERDSSAAAVAACGLDELARSLPEGERRAHYRAAAGALLARLVAECSTADHPGSNALLLRGVYDKPKGVGVNEGNLWGDYFYLEALTRTKAPDWVAYW
jgi:unsaturated chondroitin disaccharide hydrolase